MDQMLNNFYHNALSLIKTGYYKEKTRNRDIIELQRGYGRGIIGEVKFSSPSMGKIASEPINSIKNRYSKSGLKGISILTEPNYFAGSLEYIQEFSDANKPILMKDFIIDEKQIISGYTYGVDIILLIIKLTRVFNIEERKLVNFAHKLGLQVIAEANNLDEIKYAESIEPDFIGINCRDLNTMETDKKKFNLIEYMNSYDAIAMSGIESVEELKNIFSMGYRYALVGTSFIKNINFFWEANKIYGDD